MKVQIALAVLCFACVANAFVANLGVERQFSLFKISHAKTYKTSVEHNYRKSIFASNLNYIQKHNAEAAAGKHTYTLGVNKYADLTHQEFLELYTSAQIKYFGKSVASEVDVSTLPEEVDWRDEGYVTAVKDQGQCGSCWTFSATGSMEGAHFAKTGDLVSMSEQNLVDCVHPFTDGCNGGQMTDAFAYVVSNGINSESAYPYTAKDHSCTFDENAVVATMSDYVSVATKESALQEAVATIGPVSIGIDASHMSFQLYKDGVYNPSVCSSYRLDHGVLAVGYGTYEGTEYWMVKNSWGSSWGMEGYIMMVRNEGNKCGVATDASYPIA